MTEPAICDHCHNEFIPDETGVAYTCSKCRDELLMNGAWGHPFQPSAEDIPDVVR